MGDGTTMTTDDEKVEIIRMNEETGSFVLKANDPTLIESIQEDIHEDSPIDGDEHYYIVVSDLIAVETDSISRAKGLANELVEKYNKRK